MEIDTLIQNLQRTDENIVRNTVDYIIQSNVFDPKLLPSLEKLLTFDLYIDTDDNSALVGVMKNAIPIYF